MKPSKTAFMDLKKIRQRALAALAAGCACAAASRAGFAATANGEVDFNRQIRPILSDNCFTCHGPDEAKRKSGLRLDQREAPFQPAKSGAIPIVPGDPAKSQLVERITNQDPDEVMPPPRTNKKLSPQQIELLTRWIQEGAKWQEHWAYVKPERPLAPAVQDAPWPRNDIDRFVLARLEKEGLKPSPEADKPTEIRRATLDLTGLPPTPQEVDAFLADGRPEAYEKLVDRLLASPRYGEHQARYWLDVARYADSHGYHIDSERSLWKWRDWVIRAFNQNQPFDQFTTEQLAGDLLPHPTTEQKIASGYVRANMSTGEGGAIEEEYQCKYTFDRTETMGTTWLGLTLMCARCHSHKYDPISQREYYGLYAFFNSIDEAIMDGNQPNPAPSVKVPSPAQTQRMEELKKLIDAGQPKLDAPMPELDKAQAAWQERWRQQLSAGWTTLSPHLVHSLRTNGAHLRVLDDKSVLAFGPNPESDAYEFRSFLDAGRLAALRLEAVPHDSLPKKSAARADDGRFRLSEIEAEIIEFDKDGRPGKPKKPKSIRVAADTAEPKFEITNAADAKPDTGWGVAAADVAEPHAALFVLDEPMTVTANAELRVRLRFDASKSRRALGHFRLAVAQNEALVKLLAPPKLPPWQVLGPLKTEGLEHGFTNVYEPELRVDLRATYPGVREDVKWHAKPEFENGKPSLLVQDLHGVHGAFYLFRTIQSPTARQGEISVRADDAFKLWVNGEPVAERAAKKPDDTLLRVPLNLKEGENRFLLKIVTVQGAASFTFKQELIEPDAVSPEVAALLATAGKLGGPQQAQVRNQFRRQNSAAFKKDFDDVARWREENDALDKSIPTTLVAKELEKPRATVILMRGEYDKKEEAVARGMPAILPPFPSDAPTNRLGLAKWLLDPAHPLTARVTVNRIWQQYFGVGLVKTVEDFGVQGEQPSHPELLDWLATEFVRTGWDLKHLHRLIATSATYRQSAKASPTLRARDPENRLLARGPRFRLDGESVRDTALFVSGLLVEKTGGKSVKPYEPPGLWEAVSFNNSQKYVQDVGEGNYRRSLYTNWKRQSPPPNMLLFDAPTREYCVARRPRTNTPLQALALLNDLQFVEASRAFAQRILVEGGADAESRLAYAFRLATARQPGADEVKVLAGILAQQLATFRQDPAAAEKLLHVGGFKARRDLDPRELAAWTTIASLILNLDETLTKG
ncbi:MAG: PSD1 domain-containing protein [Verrucomicrobia bacterium]|nr:PSD1 domain-containing protein [Verrucomicrobiota bacterium]